MQNHFLYFLAKDQRPMIKGSELPSDHPLHGRVLQCVRQMNGPGGHNGLLFHRDDAPDGTSFPLSYSEQEQSWVDPGGGRPMVGMWRDRKPRPEDLIRPRTLDGHRVRLGDDAYWEVPVCGPAFSMLPMAWDFQTETMSVLRKWTPLFEESEKWFNYFAASEHNGKVEPENYASLMKFCLKLVATNYFVGVEEANLLEIFCNNNWSNVMLVAMGKYDLEVKEGEADYEGKSKGAA